MIVGVLGFGCLSGSLGAGAMLAAGQPALLALAAYSGCGTLGAVAGLARLACTARA